MSLTTKLFIRWSDIDANYHLRHSVYYDFCAQHRIDILSQYGLTMNVMQQQHIGPVLFREECLFKKEIRHDDTVMITTAMLKMKADTSRFTIQHQLHNEEKVFAVITVDGTWIDTQLRKMIKPVPQIISEVMNAIPKAPDFEVIAST